MVYKAGNQQDMERQAVHIIEETVRMAIKKRERAVFLLAGGRSIVGTLEGLQTADIDWSKVHIFVTDERWVPIDTPESNFGQLQEVLISHIDIPHENVHPFDSAVGLSSYNTEFMMIGPDIDVAIFGVGEDGHIASLFPNNAVLAIDTLGYVEVTDSPKPPARRISISKALLEHVDTALLLFFGEPKAHALRTFLDDTTPPTACPAKFAQSAKNLYILTDNDEYGKNSVLQQ